MVSGGLIRRHQRKCRIATLISDRPYLRAEMGDIFHQAVVITLFCNSYKVLIGPIGPDHILSRPREKVAQGSGEMNPNCAETTEMRAFPVSFFASASYTALQHRTNREVKMTMKRLILSTVVVAGLAVASAASAGEVTRSASALPTLQGSKARTAIALKKKKSQLQGEAVAGAAAGGGVSSTALIIGGIGGLAAVGGIVAATESNDSGS